MSLLSENTGTVNASEYVVSPSSLLPAQATRFLTLENAPGFQQQVGYVAVRSDEYTPVLNVTTGEPLQLPQGYVPTGFFMKAIQDVSSDARLRFLAVNSLEDPSAPGSVEILFVVGTHELNPGIFQRAPANTSGEDYDALNYLVVQNDSYPTPVTTGVVQVAVTYF